jgi:hypothetical protein
MVVAPYFQTEGIIEPYVSLNEVKFSATAAAIDFTNLIENASIVAQDRALLEVIRRASSKADIFCYGKMGTLNATSNTENGWYRPNRDGNITFTPSFSPILAVTDVQVGYGPGSGMSEITLSSSNIAIDRDQFILTAPSTLGLYFGSLGIVGGRWGYQSNMWCQYTYINGWFNSFTTSQVSAGATTFNVTDTTGLYPGMQATIWDGFNDEVVTVASVTGTTITVTTGLLYAHGTGVNISTMPAAVKQAVIHFVVAMIKERGQGGLVINEIGEPSAVSSRTESSMEDEVQGYDLLEPFKVIGGRQ